MQVGESGVFERIFSPFQRPVDIYPDEECLESRYDSSWWLQNSAHFKMYLLVDEECIDKCQIVKNVIILGDLGDNLAKEVSVPPNKWVLDI